MMTTLHRRRCRISQTMEADVVDIHLLYDAPRFDLLFKSIAQSIKFSSRFGDQQRQLRQKCQLVSSTHLLTPVNLLEAGELVFRGERARALNESFAPSPRICAVNRRGRNPRQLHSMPRLWVNRELPLPIPGEGRGPVAQSLPHWRRRLSHRLEGPNRLRGLAP